VTGACGGTSGTSAGTKSVKPPVVAHKTPAQAALAVFGADQYLQNPMDFNGAVDWTLAKTVKIELGEMFFAPKNVELQAGIPYVLELANTGVAEHEFTAATFFRSSSIRKISSNNGEVRVPFFTGIKVLPGKTVKVYAIPVVPGPFEMLCNIKGHRELGMEGRITVTGSKPTVPAPALGNLKDGPWLQNGQDLVKAANWTTAKTVRIEAGETRQGMYFKPKQLVLKAGAPYVIQLVNKGTILHEFTSDQFFPTVAFNKAQDAEGEYTSPLLKEAEVLAGQQLDLYLIPTKLGTFKIVCQLDGHEQAGMVGTIKVTS
jgi:uncharacterized cupredoxin-like copper-binding protein